MPPNISHFSFFSCIIVPSTSTLIWQRFRNVQWYFLATPHVFMITYDKYQYNFACLGLWNILTLSHNCIYPQSLSYYWCLNFVLSTRIHMLNVIGVCRIHTYKHNHHVDSIIFRHAQSILLALNIICTQFSLWLSASLLHKFITLMLSNYSQWFFS